MKKQVYIAMCVLVLFSLLASACAPAAPAAATAAPTSAAAKATDVPAKVWKMAALFPGVITDADYNTLGYLGLTEVKGALGVTTAYSESVAVPDIDRAMREYIDQGYNIIWTHGSQFLNQTMDLAKQMPNVVFIAEGDSEVKDAPTNFWLIDRNFHLGYYAIGAIAAKATKTGKIGYIGGQTLPFSYAEVHAVQQSIKDLGAKVELKTVWTGDFNDPTKGRQYADAMIADGVDVIICSLNLGIFGVFEAAKAKGDGNVLVTAKYIDKTSFAPKNYITSLIYDFKGPMVEIVKRIQKGEKGAYYPLGFATGVNVQIPLLNVPATMQPDIQKIVDDVKSGKITVVKNTDKVQ
jgi:basic membrane protein A and related proteins